MTPAERQELRCWSAEELLEFAAYFSTDNRTADGYDTDHHGFISIDSWQPDSPDAPAWQILAVIEKMRERGFCLYLIDSTKYWQAQFFIAFSNQWKRTGNDADPLIAILIAAKAAWDSEKEKP